ncbi:hypothetical protein QAD02_020804 [Eretmocerus hayati]|uniref:Uncharacterized protein n=1 Tax=Eretmocerus hayati TaxID=131215 RepID=A0ACC2PNE3_9HYME|nr:hypothetical protein QAD02_020804 [Eretmocerus hayati]
MAEAKKKRSRAEMEASLETNIISGYRIVDLCELGRNLKCLSCKTILSLLNIVSEQILGLHSILSVKCHECGTLSPVPTGKTDGRLAHINKTIVLGSIHSGAGCVTINKILACADIPGLSAPTFKRYERTVGIVIEVCARESCLRAAQEERRLTIENISKLRLELPNEMADVLFPKWSVVIEALIIVMDACKGSNIHKELVKILCWLICAVIKILASYDMGWSRRGNGRSYNSMNGYATLIGYCTQKILDYTTRNRKCKACSMGSSKENHDCRHNYTGSAKGMEADAGVELVLHSKVLQEAKLEIGVLIGDEDATTMSAIYKSDPSVNIFKLADKNHLIKNFGKELYELAKIHKELNRKGVIDHIKKCFTYAVAQNKGKTIELAQTLRTIPDHLFNRHEKCAEWCRTGDSVPHSVNLCDPVLYDKLSVNFEKYAQNSQKFAVAASSQSNESTNNIIAHKAAKNKCLSQSEACDYRVASSVCTKNDGDRYVLAVKEKLGLPPGKYTAQYFTQLDMIRKKRAEKSVLVSSKRQRLKLKAAKELSRKKNENKEGLKYQSNCAMQIKPVPRPVLKPVVNYSNIGGSGVPGDSALIDRIVYFDLELGDLYPDAALLQIAAKSVSHEFNVYITPTKAISSAASDVNSLRYISGNLYFRDKIVTAFSLVDALKKFHDFLKPNCILVAHNAPFDVPRLIRALIECNMEENFCKVSAVSDTLAIFRKILPDRKKGGLLKLSKLSEDFLDNVDGEKFHDALYDVKMLEKLVKLFKIEDALLKHSSTFQQCIENYRENEQVNSNLVFLKPLKTVLHRDTLRKIAKKRVTFDSLKSIYTNKGKKSLEDYLSERDENRHPRITQDKRTISKIVCCVEQHIASNHCDI